VMPAVEGLVLEICPAMNNEVRAVLNAQRTGQFRDSNVVTNNRGDPQAGQLESKQVVTGLEIAFFDRSPKLSDMQFVEIPDQRTVAADDNLRNVKSVLSDSRHAVGDGHPMLSSDRCESPKRRAVQVFGKPIKPIKRIRRIGNTGQLGQDDQISGLGTQSGPNFLGDLMQVPVPLFSRTLRFASSPLAVKTIVEVATRLCTGVTRTSRLYWPASSVTLPATT